MLPQFALNGVVFADTSCATAAESPCTELIVSIDPAIANANLVTQNDTYSLINFTKFGFYVIIIF